MKRWMFFLVLPLMFSFSGCGKKKGKGVSASAKFNFSNATSLTLADVGCPDLGDGELPECWTPTIYGMKIVNIIVSPDQTGATSGPAGLIWAAPGCDVVSGDLEIDDKEYKYDNASACTDDQVDTFVELARPTSEVNKELNSKVYSILPGTYNYVQMEFCKNGPSGPNARFQAEGMTSPYEITNGMCGLSSLKAEPPIVVGEGQAVTISLSYDLTNIIYPGHAEMDETSCYKNADNSFIRCSNGPNNLMPSFSDTIDIEEE